MADNDVNFRLSGDSGDAQRAWLELIGVLKQTQNEISKMGRTLERSSTRNTEAMNKQVTAVEALRKSFNTLRNANAIIGGLRTAMNLLTGEIDSAAESMDRLRTPRLKFETELAKLLKNVPTADMPGITATLEAYTGPWSPAVIAAAAARVSSEAPIGMDRQAILRAVMQTGEAFRERAVEGEPDTLGALALGVVKMYEAAPTLRITDREGREDFTKALTFMIQANQTAAQSDPLKFASNVVPRLASMVSTYGFTPRRAAAIAAATQTIASDPTGRLGSRTLDIAMEQYVTTGRQFGIGMDTPGKRFDVPKIMDWMAAGATPEAIKARQFFTGGFDIAFNESELAGMSIQDIRGRQMGAAKFRGYMRDLLMQVPGRLMDSYTTAMEQLDPVRREQEGAAKLEYFESNRRFRTLRRELDHQAFKNRIETMKDRGLDWSEAKKLQETIFDVGGIWGAERTFYQTLQAGDWLGSFGLRSPREYVRQSLQYAGRSLTAGGWARPSGSYVDDMFTEEYMRANVRQEDQDNFRRLMQYWQDLFEEGMDVNVKSDDVREAVVPAPDPAGALGE